MTREKHMPLDFASVRSECSHTLGHELSVAAWRYGGGAEWLRGRTCPRRARAVHLLPLDRKGVLTAPTLPASTVNSWPILLYL